MQRQFALDTNFLMDLAHDEERAWEAFASIQEMKPRPALIVTPTVVVELGWLECHDANAEDRAAAKSALASLKKWRISQVDLPPLRMGYAEIIGRKLRDAKLLPETERHDGMIVGESALLGCDALLTFDGDLRDMDPLGLQKVLEGFTERAFYVMSPWVAARFF